MLNETRADSIDILSRGNFNNLSDVNEYLGDQAVKNKLITPDELNILKNLLNRERTIETEQKKVFEELKNQANKEEFDGNKLNLFNELRELYD